MHFGSFDEEAMTELLDLVRGLERASDSARVSLERKWQFWPTVRRTNEQACASAHTLTSRFKETPDRFARTDFNSKLK